MCLVRLLDSRRPSGMLNPFLGRNYTIPVMYQPPTSPVDVLRPGCCQVCGPAMPVTSLVQFAGTGRQITTSSTPRHQTGTCALCPFFT